MKVDWEKLLPLQEFGALPRRWVVERYFAWICHKRRMSKDYERLCASGEAFVYAAMSRLMVRRISFAHETFKTVSLGSTLAIRTRKG